MPVPKSAAKVVAELEAKNHTCEFELVPRHSHKKGQANKKSDSTKQLFSCKFTLKTFIGRILANYNKERGNETQQYFTG